MPSSAFSRWWLLFLPFSLSLLLFLFLTHGTISNFAQNSWVNATFSKEKFQLPNSLITHLPEGWRLGPNLEVILLNLTWVLTVWRTGLTVKNRIFRWTKKKVARLSAERNAALREIADLRKKKEDLEDQLKRTKKAMTSIVTKNGLLKESCKEYRKKNLASEKVNGSLRVMMEQKVKNLETEAEIVRTSLKMSAKLLLQREGFLQHKLSQEKILRKKTEEKLNAEIKALEQHALQKNTEQEKKESSYKNQITELRTQLTEVEKLLRTSKSKNTELKESCKAFQILTSHSAEEIFGLKTSIEQERRTNQEEMNTLRNQLEKITILMQEKEITLQQKLVQEKALRVQTETALKEMNMELEKEQKSSKAQIKELLEHLDSTQKMAHSAKLENEALKELCKAFQTKITDLSEEMLGLKENLKQEQNIHHHEIDTLQNKLEMMAITSQEKETALLQKLTEEEAKAAQANGKFTEYKEELTKLTKERQHYLKNEIRLHQTRAKDNWLAYRDAEQALSMERRKTADLQRRLDALNEQMAEYRQTPSGKGNTGQRGFQNSERTYSRYQQERQPAFRTHRGNQRYYYQNV